MPARAIVLNEPGMPWQNSAVESFNGETRRQHCNVVRPHSSVQLLNRPESSSNSVNNVTRQIPASVADQRN